MSKYNDELDWDNDPFDSDIDFDMDFDVDPYAKKGFIGGLTSGFLSGIVDETIGSHRARMKTLRTVLPASFNNGLDKASFVSERIADLAKEFKEENVKSAKSLQKIAGHLSKTMEGKLPGKITGGLENFSQKDFSSWEKIGQREDIFDNRFAQGTEDEVNDAISESGEGFDYSAIGTLGDTLNKMSAAVGNNIQSAIGASNKQLINIESSIRDIMVYQRNVQAKMDQTKINLLARTYVQSAKFYKFMETGVHASIREIKKVVANSALSDYEKTSHLTATKAYARNTLFGTIGKRVGGLTGLFRDKFGEGTRKGAYGTIGETLDSLAEGLEMSDGMMSKGLAGELLGKIIAGVAVNEIPMYLSRGAGEKMVKKLYKMFPSQAKEIRKGVKELSDLGNIVSYASTSGTGMLNHLGNNFQPIDEMKYADYEDYVSQLPEGKKPINKSLWVALNAASNKSKEAINKMMSDVNRTKGTQYTLSKRNVKDLNAPGIWKEINNITLNEVLPGLLSQVVTEIKKFRTGNDGEEEVSYNYMRGQFMRESDKKISVQSDLMPHSEFQRFASAALELADSLDPDKILSSGARKALAGQIAKDIDEEKGFNPYYYLGEISKATPSQLKEIHAAVKKHFDITENDLHDYQNGDSLEQLKKMSVMGTSEGKRKLNEASATAENIKNNFPNVSERIDLLRATGNEQLLRDLGVIYNQNGIDRVDTKVFHDRIKMYMDDPNNPELKGVIKGDYRKDTPNRKDPLIINDQEKNPDSSPVNESIKTLTEALNNLKGSITSPAKPEQIDLSRFDTITGEVTSIKETNQGIFGEASTIRKLLEELMNLARTNRLFARRNKKDNLDKEKSEEDGSEKKKDIFSKLKGLAPNGVFGKGIDDIIKNNPLVLSGILGAVSSTTIKNPLLSAGITGSLLLGGAYMQWGRKNKITASTPSDDEDILDEKGEPLLKSAILKAGQYLDAVSRRVLKTWNDIKGPVYNVATKTVVGATELAGKIFGPDGRAVALTGLRKTFDAAVATANFIDPVGKIKAITELGKGIVYQQDIYVRGETSPRLRGKGFKNQEYFLKEENGEFKSISGWNEIDGPVYDNEGNCLVTEDEFKSGLVTSTGLAVRNMGGFTSKTISGLAGLLKTGITRGLGKFGFTPDKKEEVGEGENSSDKGKRGTQFSAKGIEERLDKIYNILRGHFSTPLKNKPGKDKETVVDKIRLNSLEFKKKSSEEKERSEVNKAIIKIAKNTEGLGGSSNDEKKPSLFQKLFSFIGGIGTFAKNLFKNPIGTIGNLVFGSLLKSTSRLAKIGTALFSGVLGAASPIFKLLKTGFTGLAKAIATGRMTKGLFGGGEKGGSKLGRSFKGKLGKVALGAGAAALGSQMLDNDEQGMTEFGHAETGTDKAVDLATSLYLPGFVAKTALETVVPKETQSTLDNYGLFWSSDKKFFFNRTEMEEYESRINGLAKTGTGAYTPLKMTREFTTQKRLRFAMYGLAKVDNELGDRIQLLENLLYPYIVINNDRASLKRETPIESILQQFINAASGTVEDKDAVATWFTVRFKPVFLVFNAAASIAKFSDINSFDHDSTYSVVQVSERVSQTVSTLDPYPFNIDVRIDPKIALMGDINTRGVVKNLLSKLQKDIPNPVKDSDIKIPTANEERKKLEEGKSGVSSGLFGNGSMGLQLSALAAKASQEDIAQRFKQPEQVKDIDISDTLRGKDVAMDPFVMARLSAYGNDSNIPWRVEAVLKLERYIESFIVVIGEGTRFTGNSGTILSLFKPLFRIGNDKIANNWLLWFRDRFLPVVMTYIKEVKRYTGNYPEKNWERLSASNKADIAKVINAQTTKVGDKVKSIWEIKVGPFEDSQSGEWSDVSNKYLKILDNKAQTARLKDPELETFNSKPQAERVGFDQTKQNSQLKEKTQNAVNNVLKTGTSNTGNSSNSYYGSISSTPGLNVKGIAPNPTMDAGGGAGSAGEFTQSPNMKFNPEFLKVAGEDKGIKMSLQQGEQLLLNHLVKAGFKDIKTLAMALAMARKETGGYSSTVENTNWSAPTLMKYFKNIPDLQTAQKVAAMSPPERAMYVYGRAPKAASLGNDKLEDGWDYRGRGLFQLTGKANYERFKKETGIDVVSNPRLVSEDPNVMAETAVNFLKNNKALKSIAQTGDFDTAVRGINGGNPVPATDERRQYYNDYLNKLKSGQLGIVGNTEGETPETGPNTDVPPAAPDKNAPDLSKQDVGTPATQDGIKSLLADNDPTKSANNVGNNPSTTSAGLDSQIPSGGNSAPDMPASSSPSITSPSNPVSQTPVSVPSPIAPSPVVPQQNQKTSDVNISFPKEGMDVKDDVVASILTQALGVTNQQLSQILDVLKSNNRINGGSVKMN